jgi:hypothetical protein
MKLKDFLNNNIHINFSSDSEGSLDFSTESSLDCHRKIL